MRKRFTHVRVVDVARLSQRVHALAFLGQHQVSSEGVAVLEVPRRRNFEALGSALASLELETKARQGEMTESRRTSHASMLQWAHLVLEANLFVGHWPPKRRSNVQRWHRV